MEDRDQRGQKDILSDAEGNSNSAMSQNTGLVWSGVRVKMESV